MSAALSLSASHLPICKSQDLSKNTHLPKSHNTFRHQTQQAKAAKFHWLGPYRRRSSSSTCKSSTTSIVASLGGRAAEEVFFGESEITTGAAGDLQQITQ
uniref:Peptidase M41 domain-containing protein n=1 Tax=Davidia involucrata TaxID=16924 RepID=A0A5B6YP16_DAVIN